MNDPSVIIGVRTVKPPDGYEKVSFTTVESIDMSTRTKADTITVTFAEDVAEGDLLLVTKRGVQRGQGWNFNAIALQPAKAGEPIIAVVTAQVPTTVQQNA